MNMQHKVFRDVVTDMYQVYSTFDPVELLTAKSSTLASLVINRVAEAMAKPIIEFIEPAFRQALQETLQTIQEKINAAKKDTAKSTTANAPEAACKGDTDPTSSAL